MISPPTLAKVRELVKSTGIHHGIPVDLSPLIEGITVAYLPLSQNLMGFSIVRPPQTFVAINQGLDHVHRRRVLAHELGHILSDHPSAIHYMDDLTWLAQRLEAEAEAVAAFLLVPWPLPSETRGLDLPSLAALLEIPVEILQLRGKLAAKLGI